MMYHKGAIESYPLQTYASALLLSPTGSLIRQLFQHEEPERTHVMATLSDGWSACMQTLEGHSNTVMSVAFSHDSTRPASASDDGTVKIWDASSGACLQTLKGYSSYVSSADLGSVLAVLYPDKIAIKPHQSVRHRIAISVDNIWVSDNAEKLLWLPTEYRPVIAAVSGRCVCLGTGSGKVWICRFK
jgi:WD40 repeat protein